MKKLLTVAAGIATGYGVLVTAAQARYNLRKIVNLSNENIELRNELRNEIRELRNKQNDLKHQHTMLKMDVDHEKHMRRFNAKEIDRIGSKLHEERLNNIKLNGKINRMEIRNNNKPLRELTVVND